MTTPDRRPTVIGLGELLWDVFPDGRRPGGAPANFAFQTEQLGCHGVLATRVGADVDGDELLQALREKSLDLSIVQRDPERKTGWVSVTLRDGHPEYVIHENVAWDAIEFTPALQSMMQQAAAVCFGTLAQRSGPSRTAIHAAVSATPAECLRVYDVNLRQSYYAEEWVSASLRLATIVKLNDEEVPVVARLLGIADEPLEFSRLLITRFDLQIVCITRGAKGCLVVTQTEHHDVPGKAIKVADTVGAGDAFTAGFVFAQLQEWPVGLSAEFANRVGAMVASRQGAMPELRREFAQLIEQY
ncbi:carbohydrate kinase family protein [Planctomicrobium piriforme]|uniref:Fructokinase n=1 Tax=Planctomicrobium piriforme TaxID=1576369 RepID=A0A1I3AZW4_9PLAN|nr:carbohydrate kinase [Planctomicrobium piriforme]SFH55249.1 fructokinase [Planctomicrobium piriforme]